MLSRPNGRLRGVLVAASLVALAACGGGGGGSSSGGGDVAGSTKNAVAAPTGAVSTKLQPQLNGWAFPNFPSATFPDLNFDTADLVSMFGSGPDVCVDGVAEPCTLTAEAAAWARMVNQARATGHCEGLVVLASARYNRAELPETVKLPSQEEEIRAVMRAFATQFVPEVQKSIEGWTKASLAEKIDELKRSFATDKLQYTLGVYVEGGGHAVLPYAIEYPTPDVARIMVYDSNWPGRNRYVDVDLANDKWSFSFAGDDPAADPNMWSGGSQDMDLTPFEAREGTCPFCGDGTKLQSTTLLVRTENLDWSVETENGAVSPTTPVSGDGSSARPVKGGVAITRLAPRAAGRSSFDYLVTIPNELLEGTDSSATTAAGDATTPVKKRAKLKFGGASSVFAVMKTGVAQFTTPGGGDDKPVELGTDSIKSNDPSVDLTLASGNLVANASGPSVELGSSGGSLEVAVTTATGEVIEQQVTPDAPAVQVKADETGGVTVLEANATGEVKKTEVAADGTKTETVVDASALNLNKVEVELPPALESKPIAALPKLEDRNLSNPNYKADEAYVPPTTVPLPKENAAGPTTTVRGESPSTVQTRNAALPTTTTPRAVTAAGVTPTTIAAVVRPTLANFRIAAKTFGDDAFTLDPPDSNSPGGFRYTSSRTEVATVSATTGRVTIVGAGTTTITATQAAVRGFEAGTITATLTVAKAAPDLVVSNDITKNFGDVPFTIKDPTSNSTGAFTITSSDESVLKQSRITGRWVIGGAGRTTIRVSQAATDDYLAASDSFTVTVRKGTPDVKAPADVTKSFTDAEFDLPKPTSESRGALTYSSSDAEVLSVTSAGRATIKSTGTVTITVSQATTDDWLAASSTFKVTVGPVTPTITEFADLTKTFGDDTFTLARPKSASLGAFTFTSSDEKVVKVGSADGKVTIVGAGTVTITAKQAAAKGYNEASATAKITVGKAAVTISDLLVADREFGAADFSLKPTSNSAGKFTYSTDKPDVFKVDEETGNVKIIGVGTATLTVKQAATANYEVGSASATVTVKKGTPTLTWEPGSKTFGDPEFELTNPTSPSSGKFTFTVASTDSSRARINSSGRLVILRAGTVSLTATQASTNLWNEASITGTLTIDKASPTITGFTIPSKTYGDPAFDLTAPTSDSPAPFTYEIVAGTSSEPDVASVASLTGRVTLNQAGTVQIRARQVANENFTAGSVTATLTLNKVSQLSNAAPTFGFTPTSVVVSTPTTLVLVGGAGAGTVTFSVVSAGTTQCIVSQNQQSGSWSIYAMSTGTCSVKAAKAGDRNYLPIESATTNITVAYGQLVAPSPAIVNWYTANENQTITMVAPTGQVVTKVDFASYGTPSGNAGSFTVGTCHSSSSQVKVEEAFLGKNSATIVASNAVFGDPCGGTVKRLYVKVTYGVDAFPAQAGGVGADSSSALLPLSDGSMIVIGTHTGPSTFGTTFLEGKVDPAYPSEWLPQTFIAKLSSVGTWSWAQNFSHGSTNLWGYPSGSAGGEVGPLAADVFPDDSIVIAGRFGGTLTLGSTTLTTSCATGELFVAKMTSSRAWLWAVQSGGCAYNTLPLGVAAAVDGTVYVSGRFQYASVTIGATTLSPSSARGFVARISPSGAWGWVKETVADCEELRLEASGTDIYAYGTCGLFNANIWTDYEYREGQSNVVVTKINSSGTFQWQTTVTSPSWVRGHVKALRVQDDGTLIVAGTYGNGMVFGGTTMTNTGLYVAKMSSTGSWQWISTGGARNGYDGVGGIAIQANGTIVVAAIYQQWGTPTYGTYTLAPSDHQRDIALLKLGSGGTWLAAERIGNVSNGWSATEDAIDIEVLPNGKTVLLANFSSTSLSVGTATVSTTGGSDILITTR